MVRLNYTARKISGVKAGLAVKKDLNKRIPSTTTFKVRDPVLEIDVSGKELTDDGFNEFIFDLCIALQSASPEYPQGINKLQELHLKGNQLTVDALVELAKVIQLSSRDLKELDISNNDINIFTISDAHKWKYFLQSFSQCCVLKKIDFSGNSLRTMGMDILARVYIRSELDFVETVLESEDEDLDDLDDLLVETTLDDESAIETAAVIRATKAAHRRTSQVNTSKLHTYTDAGLRRYACTRGLRSVPYIVLQNVSMTNGAIVHLAEMLKMHRSPEKLLSFLPSGKPPSLPSPEHGAGGIYWLPNDGISQFSARLMKLTEEMHSIAENESDDGSITDLADLSLDDFDQEEIDRAQEERERHRRHRQTLAVNLSRITSQQRIHMLATERLRKSVLWHCALRMLAVAREILLDYTNRPISAEEDLVAAKRARIARLTRLGPPVTSRNVQLSSHPQYTLPYEPPKVKHGRLTDAVVSIPQRPEYNGTPRGALISSLRFDPRSSTFDRMFPAMHHQSENPLMQVNPPPVAAAMPNYPLDSDSKDVSKDGKSATNNNNDGENHLSSSSVSPSGRGGKKSATSDTYRTKYRFGLPLHLWRRIITEGLSANGILHPDQQMKIVTYAASWGALEAEIAINGAAEHQQVWKILESIDCFTYKPLS